MFPSRHRLTRSLFAALSSSLLALAAVALGHTSCGGGGESSTGTSGTGGNPPSPMVFEEITTPVPHEVLTGLTFIPGTDELFVIDKLGSIFHYRLDGDELTKLGELKIPNVFTETDCGLVSMALDPDFTTNGFFYVGYCVDRQSSRIARLTFDPSDYAGIPDSATEVMVVAEPLAKKAWHNVGSMGFDADGYMWAFFGEKTLRDNAQDLSKNLGKLLRFAPKPDGVGFDPRPGNPFVNDPEKSAAIYAYGFRSPWRGIIDSKGRFWIGDVGADSFEEVDLITEPGQNFGWPLREGNAAESPTDAACAGCVDPLVSWPHASGHKYAHDDDETVPTGHRIAWIGYRWEDGSKDPYDGKLDRVTLFGDAATGWVRGLEVDDDGKVLGDVFLGHLGEQTGCDRGPDGYIYIATLGTTADAEEPRPAKIWRMTPR